MLIHLIRHGETDWNRTYRLQGWSDIPLNEGGLSQAMATGAAMRDIPIDIAYTSPLLRASRTAEAIMAGRGKLLIPDERLKEINFGEAEGKTGRNPDGQPADTVYDFYRHPERYVPPAGGESVYALCRRTWDFLEELTAKKDLSDSAVLVATHGAALRSMLLYVRFAGPGMAPEQVPVEKFWDGGLLPNCSVTTIESRDGALRILEEARVYAQGKSKPLVVTW